MGFSLVGEAVGSQRSDLKLGWKTSGGVGRAKNLGLKISSLDCGPVPHWQLATGSAALRLRLRPGPRARWAGPGSLGLTRAPSGSLEYVWLADLAASHPPTSLPLASLKPRLSSLRLRNVRRLVRRSHGNVLRFLQACWLHDQVSTRRSSPLGLCISRHHTPHNSNNNHRNHQHLNTFRLGGARRARPTSRVSGYCMNSVDLQLRLGLGRVSLHPPLLGLDSFSLPGTRSQHGDTKGQYSIGMNREA